MYILTLNAFCISVKYTLIIQQDIIFKTGKRERSAYNPQHYTNPLQKLVKIA